MEPIINRAYRVSKEALRSIRLFEPVRRARNRIKSHLLVQKLRRSKPFKLEIGGGNRPADGYVHLDALDSLPSWRVDVIHDVRRGLPFPDGIVAEILTNHCIEHVSWRELPKILRDYYRVLIPGGRLLIRTPDLESIARNYLNRSIIFDNDTEAQYLEKHFGGATQSWMAILKLFAGQDYVTNFHYAAYDFGTLKNILHRAGFSEVHGPDALPAYSHDELRVVAYKSPKGAQS